MSDQQPDQRLPDGTRLVRPLGAGAMGEVWVGDSIREGEVAVKFLAEAVRHDPSAVRRFEREWQMARSIDSPHVVRMIARGELSDGLPYIVMELLEGESLEERLERHATLGPTPAVAIFRQVASALDRAHAQGIVHRDIKPENILLCGPNSQVKILDFGLAKPFSQEGFSLTKTGVLMGTPFYMAPEQIKQGGRDFDGRADHWALAAVAYRTLLGAQPFDAESLHALVLAILQGKYVPVAEAGGDRGLEPFFARAFALERDDRFPSATAMVEALARVLDGGLIDEPTALDLDGPHWDADDDDDWGGAQPTREYDAHRLLQNADDEDDDGPATTRISVSEALDETPPLSGPVSEEPPTQRHLDDEPTVDRDSALPDARDSSLELEPTVDLDDLTPPIPSAEPETMRWHDADAPPASGSGARVTVAPGPSRGRRWLPIIVGANVVALGVLAIVMTMRSPTGPTQTPVPPVPSQPVAPAPQPIVAPEPPPVVPSASASTSASATAPAPAATSSTSYAEPSDDPEAALLTVECKPVCIVIVDGVSHGVSPLRSARFRPGKHEVKAYRDDRGARSVSVDIPRGKHVTHRFDLGRP